MIRSLPCFLILLFSPFTQEVAVGGETILVPADKPTIQAAMDQASSGDIVLVSAGTYREHVVMKPGVTLRSAGDDSPGKLGLLRAERTIIDGGHAENAGPGVAMESMSVLDGFAIANVGVYDDARWNHHYATQGNEQSHEHIGKPGTPGVSIVGVSCMVRNNIVHHNGYTGIAIQGVDGKTCTPHIHRNVCYRNMGGGIGSMKKSGGLIEENQCFENFYAGIGHDDASPIVINNVCYKNIRAGIGISHGSSPMVRGNKCYENRRAGIGTRTGSNTRPVIDGNECFQNHMAGIGNEEEAAPMIRNNRCYRNQLAGIGSRTRATPTIIGNECYENDKVGIGQQSDAVTVLVNNHCHHNKAAGIGFDPCEAGRSRVSGNRVIDNKLVAIGIQSGWTVELSDNELRREGGMPPLIMVFKDSTATIVDNVMHGGGVAGIRVAGTVRITNNRIVGEKMRPAGPPNFGVWALPGSQVTMINNQIERWRHGVSASEASLVASHNTVKDFHRTAIVIQKSATPPAVFENVAISANPDDIVTKVGHPDAMVQGNRLTIAE